jgi:hypothetical protein
VRGDGAQDAKRGHRVSGPRNAVQVVHAQGVPAVRAVAVAYAQATIQDKQQIAAMRVSELRNALHFRQLSQEGRKPALKARLEAALGF